MRIESYFDKIRKTIESSPVVRASNITYDKRATYEGFIHGEVYFVDGSVLHLREFVDAEGAVDRLMYVYQYMDAAQTLIFRYDNTGHHKELGLPSYPHHKHEGSQDNIIASPVPDLTAVLNEVEQLVELP